nr:ATP synthase F0 subunit 8 [Sebastapistes coniorta]
MPQLDPKPWLLILLFSWMCFLTILPPKIMSYLFSNPTKTRPAGKDTKNAWTWPWPRG